MCLYYDLQHIWYIVGIANRALALSLVKDPRFVSHWSVWPEMFRLRHSARLPKKIISPPHNAPSSLLLFNSFAAKKV